MSMIQLSGISKKYHLRHEVEYFTLRDAIISFIRRPFRFLKREQKDGPSGEDFWALNDVSFEVEEGQVVGIIGSNGAGKTTLLKILSRITHPTKGEARIRGHVSSLLEVGTGFHLELTGRENIFFNGAILGMKKEEIKKKFDEIAAFAEIEKFLDIPTKRYSNGMVVRLAFAVAAHLESEILLIDEVLSIGDIAFQKKCLGKMNNLANEGRTILFVTHNMGVAASLCSKGILLDKGKVIHQGAMSDVIRHYLKETSMPRTEIYLSENHKGLSGELRFRSVKICGAGGEKISNALLSEGFLIEIEYEVLRRIQSSFIEITLWNAKGECAFVTTDIDHKSSFDELIRMPGRYIAQCPTPGDYLRSGMYKIDIAAATPYNKTLDKLEGILSVEVIDDKNTHTKVFSDRPGIIAPALVWQTRKVDNGK